MAKRESKADKKHRRGFGQILRNQLIKKTKRAGDCAENGEIETLRARLEQVEQDRDLFRAQRNKAREQRNKARAQGSSVGPNRRKAQDRHKNAPPRHDRIGLHIKNVLAAAGVVNGHILEIGGRKNPHNDHLSAYSFTNLDLSGAGEGVRIGDITHCPEIDSESYDAVISVDVLEHVNRPWLAANEIARILKKGGVTYHSTLFSWRYHPCPIDYWRFTPACLEFLFDSLELIESGFDDLERRRNILGKGRFALKPDTFGGWRENWRVFYAGRKPL